MMKKVLSVLCCALMSAGTMALSQSSIALSHEQLPSESSTELPQQVLRIVTSEGEELQGALVYFLPSHRSTFTGAKGILNTDVADAGDNQVFVLHPGYSLFESSFARSAKNLIVRSLSQTQDAQQFAALPEFERILQSCRPKTGSSASASVAPSMGTLHPTETQTATAGAVPAPEAGQAEARKTTEHSTQSLRSESEIVLNLSISPNPAADDIHLRYTLAKDAEVIVELFRLSDGRRIVLEDQGMKSRGENVLDLHLATLSAGSYAIILRSSTCQYALSTFVKN